LHRSLRLRPRQFVSHLFNPVGARMLVPATSANGIMPLPLPPPKLHPLQE
jgi:hypothetical protein